MATASVETGEVARKPTVIDRIVDAARHGAHLSHEAQLLKSVAEDAIEDGVHAARRAMTSVQRRVETLEDLKDEAAHRVKRQPFKAIGIAAGVGLVCGLAVGWIGARFSQRKPAGNC